jgi:hypothetical protein
MAKNGLNLNKKNDNPISLEETTSSNFAIDIGSQDTEEYKA